MRHGEEQRAGGTAVRLAGRRREPAFARLTSTRGVGGGHLPAAAGDAPGYPPDIGFLARHGVRDRALDLAARLAAARGTKPSEELLAAGFDPRRYWSALAADLGVGFLGAIRNATLLSHAGHDRDALRRADAVLVHMGGNTVLLVAPGPDAIAALRHRLQENPDLASHVRIATPATIRSFIAAQQREALSRRAVDALAAAVPALSASHLGAKGVTGPKTLLAAVTGLFLLAPVATFSALGLLCTLFFCNCSFWKLAAAFGRRRQPRTKRVPGALLPTYSVLVPLYREAAIIPDLIKHLTRLDYPALCIKRTKAGIPGLLARASI